MQERLGLGYDDLRADNARLVFCSITGFGPSGPYAGRSAYDVPVAAMGGLLSITGPADGPPAKVGVALTDVLTGLHAHGAILAALHERAVTGLGRRIDCSLLETQIASLINVGTSVLTSGGAYEPRRWGTAHASVVPYEVFSAADADMVVAAASDPQFAALAREINCPHLATNTKFASNAARVHNREELVALLSEQFSRAPRAEWIAVSAARSLPLGTPGAMPAAATSCTRCKAVVARADLSRPTAWSVCCCAVCALPSRTHQRLSRAGLAVTPVNTVAQALDDPQVVHRRMVCSVDHSACGSIRLLGAPVKLDGASGTDGEFLPPPTLGEHTREVLREVLGAARCNDALLERGRQEGWL